MSKYVIINKKLGDYVVIVDTNKPEINYRLLVEEQRVGNIVYHISDSYAPALDNIYKRISVGIINEDKVKDYQTVHGIDLRDGKISSYYLIEDKNKSSHGGEYLTCPTEYYDEVINAFLNLIDSGKSEFTNKALAVLEDAQNLGSKTNAL